MMELFRATIYRQTMFSEFERRIYEKAANDEPLPADILSDIYYELNKVYFGSDCAIDDEIRYEWERIPDEFEAHGVKEQQIAGGQKACAERLCGKISAQNAYGTEQ